VAGRQGERRKIMRDNECNSETNKKLDLRNVKWHLGETRHG
jgi:hypothetical protein